ncbi:hypothetical protein, partial [Arthrobacter sp. HMWF013]|uniref:hypothetical protein n=1 Tax=Arthrobacter sp. HMWF013 TaxID=2056849 RepID=UPI000D4559C3
MRTTNTAEGAAEVTTGVIAGPIHGLRFETPTLTGFTNERGEFQYRKGEAVTFLLGGLTLGSVEGAAKVNLAQLASRVDGNIDKLHDPTVTNLARLVQTLDQDGNGEAGVTIAPIVHDLIGPVVINFNQAATDPAGVADDAAGAGHLGSEAMVAFASNQAVAFATDPQ